MVEILSLKPEDEKRLHPEAARWLNKYRAEIEREVPLQELSDDDLDTWLSDTERREFMSYKNELNREVDICINIVEVSADPESDTTAKLNLLKFQYNTIRPIYNIKLLLERAYERKVEEQRKRERDEAWRVAYKAVNPPLDEAKRYLDDKEYEEFIQAARKAIKAYLKKGEDYLDDVGTFDYQRSLEKIQRIKEEERQKAAAESEAKRAEQAERERLKQVKAQFSCAEEGFKQKLSHDKLLLTYPLEQYHPDLWFNFEPLTNEKILTWLRPEADALIPEKLRELVTWRWLSKHAILIQAYYKKERISCIAFNFMVTIVARVIFYFKAGTYNYSGFTLKLPEEERLGEVIIQKKNYEPAGELSVPISLLCLLISDQLEAQDIEVTSICDNYTVYRVRGFKGEVAIHDDFRRFLRDICHENGLVKGLLAWGLIDKQIAEIVETKMNELGQLQAEQKPSPFEDNIKRKGTKKARAFQLFSEGKGPDSPEVKALGMHKSTRYKYYKQYLATRKP